ncbi:hypothetical protein EVJ58_g10184 [Rhodofomes roseus]|uniref:Uncharacterized protein n=1 Tax=Rhodofomes roseus TaxID=34475 RepID=A0A4Y9XQS6_9APHY|nr:hypothetical protein EVJ58_g10184 [Rhodofomes roseus]
MRSSTVDPPCPDRVSACASPFLLTTPRTRFRVRQTDHELEAEGLQELATAKRRWRYSRTYVTDGQARSLRTGRKRVDAYPTPYRDYDHISSTALESFVPEAYTLSEHGHLHNIRDGVAGDHAALFGAVSVEPSLLPDAELDALLHGLCDPYSTSVAYLILR